MPMTRYPEGVEITEISGGNVAGLYLGDHETDGTWRSRVDGTTMKHERRESGSYVAKQSIDSSGNAVTPGTSTAEGAILYLGPAGTDGSWRIRVDGTTLKLERRESGTYATKATLSAAGAWS